MGISQELHDRLSDFIDSADYDYERPEWNEYFMDIAFAVSKRSHDCQTQVGAIIVNQSNEIVTTGYNGFIRGAIKNILPNKRPLKYPWMIHAEHNAVLSAARQGKSVVGCKAYCTMHPCVPCAMALWQAGIEEVYFRETSSAMLNKEHEIDFQVFQYVTHDRMKFHGV